ncbi:putative OPA3-like protein CG13603 [Vanessa cardui]|uniref:putative OPA3-like protein CG13603 n=1 Tax=Vanessa cardui TaxID=171605 RepID=UPI001F149557|nr:putative OPA3-like protein CG13603 [Vanessa cardui]
MVGHQFPMFRFATLMARQLSSPIAARIKRYAVSHPRFGVAVCIRIANFFHWCEWSTRAWTLRLAGVALPANARPPPLPVRMAVNLGGDLLGEIIIFSLGSLIIIFEVNRQANKQEDKKLYEKSEWLAIALSLEELQRELRLQQLDIERFHSTLLQLKSLQEQSDSPSEKR